MCWRCQASRGAYRARRFRPSSPRRSTGTRWRWTTRGRSSRTSCRMPRTAAPRTKPRSPPKLPQSRQQRRSMPPESAAPDAPARRRTPSRRVRARRRRRRRSGSLPRRSSWRRCSSSSTVRMQTWKRGRRRWRTTTAGRRPRIVPSSGDFSTGSSEERRSAERIVDNYSDEIERTEVPAAGELMRLRKRFHRTMLIGWFVAIAAGLVLWSVLSSSERRHLRRRVVDRAGLERGRPALGLLLLTSDRAHQLPLRLVALPATHRRDADAARGSGSILPPCPPGGRSPPIASPSSGGLDGAAVEGDPSSVACSCGLDGATGLRSRPRSAAVRRADRHDPG